jgi:hypothetical protein
MTNRPTRISEAPESSAGDDFHVLWTIKRSFELLNFNDDGLKAIAIEGVDKTSSRNIDPHGDKLLGVDLAEYFGGDNFKDSKKVVISQLKYSTRRSTENWTFYNLYTGKKGKSVGSIIHRLSQIFQGFYKEYGRENVLEKLQFNFVSNRSFSPKQKNNLERVIDFLDKCKSKTYTSTIIKKFPELEDSLKKLHNASKLNSIEFTDFLRLFKLDTCGTGSRYNQEIEIVKAIHNLGIQKSNQSDNLFRMVWRKMLPESIDRGENNITSIDLMDCLDVTMQRLFPVTNDFEKVKKVIQRQQTKSIVNTIINNKSGKPIVLHGGAGVGKSTISNQIAQEIPFHSEIILYDCYGSGNYLNPSDKRHLHKEAILQISNTLAKRIGSPFLISTESESYLYIREFKNRIKSAIEILKSKNPDAVLIVLIDAADNSITASQNELSGCFIHDLVSEEFHQDFRLVLTSRTYRVDSLKLPQNSTKISIPAFSFAETKEYLLKKFPNSSDNEIREFHDLTKGIPRVQSYSISLKKEGIKEIINYLKPNGKQVEDILNDRISEAKLKLGQDGQHKINLFFTYLISLPRPVPLFFISKLTAFNELLLKDLTTDIWHGLISDNNQISFRDEDFETYVRQNFIPNENHYNQIADIFHENAITNSYASENLGLALYQAKRYDLLNKIVIENQLNSVHLDPIKKKEIFISRSKLALKVNNLLGDKITFFKIAFIAADAAKTDTLLNNLLADNIDLLASIGESETIEKIIRKTKENLWGGPLNYLQAAILSRGNNNLSIAKQHFITAEKWVQWKQQRKDLDRDEKFDINYKDIAYGAEAILKIWGAKSAVKWLLKWKPQSVGVYSANHLFHNLSRHYSNKEISEWVKDLQLPIFGKIFIVIKLNNLHSYDLNSLTSRLRRTLKNIAKPNRYIYSLVLSFCEVCAKDENIDNNNLVPILDLLDVNLPEHIPNFTDSYDDGDSEKMEIFFRKTALKNSILNSKSKLEDIFPQYFIDLENIKEKKDDSLTRKKEEFIRFYKHALPIFQYRSDIIVLEDNESLPLDFEKICSSIKNDWELRYYDHWSSSRISYLAKILADTIALNNSPINHLESILKSFEDNNKILLRKKIIKKLATTHVNNICYQLLGDIEEIISVSNLPATEIVEIFVDCSKFALSFDDQLSKYYFDKAIEAVNEIDIEAQDQIKCISNLSLIGLPKCNPQLAEDYARFVEYCNNKLRGYDRFPMTEAINGLARMNLETSLAVLCNWDHKRIIELNKYIINIFHVGLVNNQIPSSIATSILPLNSIYDNSFISYAKKLLDNIDRYENGKKKSETIDYIFRLINISCQNRKRIYLTDDLNQIIANGNYIKNDTLNKINAQYKFISSYDTEKTYNSNRQISESSEKKEDIKINDININSYESLNEGIKRISVEDKAFFSSPVVLEFLTLIKDNCHPSQYTSHLEAFIRIDPKLITFRTFLTALEERIKEWKFHPLVKKWMNKEFETLLKLWFSEFSWDDYIDYSRIKDVADLFEIQVQDLNQIISKLLPEKIGLFSASTLYETISFLKDDLNKDQNHTILSWVLNRWKSAIKDESGLFHSTLATPLNFEECITNIYRYLLGHPDTRIRWRGVHSLNHLSKSDNSIHSFLLDQQNKTNCLPFQNETYWFYWISAKLYLWISISYASSRDPEQFTSFKSQILEEITNKDLPHILIRYFVVKAAENLIRFNESLFSDEEKNTIHNALKSPFKRVEKKILSEKYKPIIEDNKDLRFKFDWMDTLPYWFKHAADVFSMQSNDIAYYAEKFIIEKWGATNGCRDKDPVNSDFYRSYELTSHRHGSLPTIEKLDRYLEYHGMYSAVGVMLEKFPINSKDSDEWGSFEYWLESEALSFNNIFLSDLRDGTPLQNKFWNAKNIEFNKDWKENISDAVYDSCVGFNSPEHRNLFLHGGYSIYWGKNYETVSVNSALVSSTNAHSLLRALQTCESNHDYGLPIENSEFEIKSEEFKLIGWINEISTERNGLDENDPFYKNIDKKYVKFAQIVRKQFNIRYQDLNRKGFVDDRQISQWHNWNNLSDNNYHDQFESGGCKLDIDVDFLLSFLEKVGMSLIVECSISRQLEERDYDYSKNTAKLYLINSNGEVETLRGENFKIR